MITDKGKELLARYLTGDSAAWAGAFEFGVGETAASSTDTSLEFPFVRVPIDYVDYFYNTTTAKWNVRFRGVLKEGESGQMHEIGVFTSDEYPGQEVGNQLLLDYSGLDTVYALENATVSVQGSRVGQYGTLISTATTGSVRAYRPGLDLGVFTSNDTVNLAYDFTQTAGVPNVSIRFESTPSDYFEYTFAPAVGYNIESTARSAFVATGVPTWNTANTIFVSVDAQSDLLLDGIMIEDTINVQDYGMVIREVLGQPIVKSETKELEVTFDLELNF